MKNLFLFDSREDENVVIKHLISYKRKKIKLDNYYSFFEILSFKQKKSNIHAKMVYLISLGEKSPKKTTTYQNCSSTIEASFSFKQIQSAESN